MRGPLLPPKRPITGRSDRARRITERRSGAWGTTSSDLLFVAARIFRLSKDESSSRKDKNMSRFVYAGIPLLLAAVHSFAIEYESIGNVGAIPQCLGIDPLEK